MLNHCAALVYTCTAQARVVITANRGAVGEKMFPLKANVDRAVYDTPVKLVLVASRTEDKVSMVPDRDISLEEVITCIPVKH